MGAGRTLICLTCMTEIQSRGRHDFRRCACQSDSTSVSVDGGDWYERLLIGPKAKWVWKDRPAELFTLHPGPKEPA